MDRFGKGPTFALLVLVAVLVAGLFGMLHNQLSYSVGASYFHDFKFLQFGIPEDRHNRLGAAIVGWHASWWMGLLIGLPVMLFGFFWVNRTNNFLAAGLGAIGSAIIVTLMAAMLGLLAGMLGTEAPFSDDMNVPQGITDRAGFLRAAFMHTGSYFGGLLGLLVGFWAIWRVGHLERQYKKSKGDSHET